MSIGAIPSQIIRQMIDVGHIKSRAGIADGQIQPSSIDLTISSKVVRLEGSFLPKEDEELAEILDELNAYETVDSKRVIDLRKSPELERDAIYVAEVNETLRLPDYVYGYTNNKSSTGRINLQTRTVSCGNSRFDKIKKGFRGKLYLEIIPKSFPVALSPGDSLNQMRLFTGDSVLSDLELSIANEKYKILYGKDGKPLDKKEAMIDKGLMMSVDLENDIIGWKAKNCNKLVWLNRKDHYNFEDFWEPIKKPGNGRIFLKKGEFYIFSTREYIRVPPVFAAEMVPYDVSSGEFRSHYAGFFDPGFGYGTNGEILGTPAVLEVIVYENDFILRHGQPVCKMVFERLMAAPETIYGHNIHSHYQHQRGPKLSKHFKNET